MTGGVRTAGARDGGGVGIDSGSIAPEIDALEIDVDGVVSATTALIDAGPDEFATVRCLVDLAERFGLEVEVREVAAGRPNVDVVLPGGSAPGLLFLGHSDVVPAGTGWTQDPFVASVRSGRVVGRGSADMKGGLAAVLGAMGAVRAAGVQPAGEIRLACVVDEEDAGLGIRDWVSRPQIGTWAACVVAEPTSSVPIVGCRGAANLEVTVTGRSAHAGRPENGLSAVVAAAAIVTEIARMHAECAADPHPVLGAASWNPGRIDGGTGPSIVAGSCVLQVDRRLLPGESADDIARELQVRLASVVDPEIDVEVRVDMEMPGFVTDPTGPLMTSAIDALAAAGAGATEPQVWTASCDGGFVARDHGVDTIVLGPGDVQTQAHQPDESVEIAELGAMARTYLELISRTVGFGA